MEIHSPAIQLEPLGSSYILIDLLYSACVVHTTTGNSRAIVKSGVGRGLTHLIHLPSVYASIVKFRVIRFACCGINVGTLKYEYGCIVYLFL